jgi:uncharacterized membrane protein
LSLGVLIYFIHHTAASIQVANLVARVGESLEKGIDKLYPQKAFFPERLGRGPSEETEPGLPGGFEEEAASLRADRSGYLQTVDEDGLLETATEHDLVISLERRPGDFIVKSKVLVRVWPGERLDEALFGEFKDKFAIGVHRSQEQDLGFLFEELVEVALRALSTGIDDPLTAVMCLDRIGAALAQLAAREIPSPYRHDEAGKLRVIAPPLTFAEAVKLTLAPIRRHGADDAMVLAHLLKTVEEIAEFVGKPRDREVLLAEAALVVRSARKNLQE